ncbi:MAG: tRNA glutamyl-Q(34) synthetase GluQRS [Myxococcaceae bacterium]|nr:tRNA glutamyl-Q(34) synthetase GluQRS [Myxococcaceae bacterium]
MTSGEVGRFAPSPTGRLHLGNLRSALLGWLSARAVGGRFLLRIEDLDPDRSKQAHVDGIFEDLEFLGLDWDGEVLFQSKRAEVYRAALEQLSRAGRVYPCTCSRAEVLRAASAPHAGEEGPLYPGTCRDGAEPKAGRRPSLRFRVAPGVVRLVDEVCGPYEQDVERSVGDFLVQRADGVASYQLAVVVDDAASGVTRVVRGDDLLSSTPRQLQLLDALGLPAPRYAHVPLLLQEDGKRLAKRDGAMTAPGLRARGFTAQHIIGLLAKWSGLGDGGPISARELAAGFLLDKVRREPTVVHEAELLAPGR